MLSMSSSLLRRSHMFSRLGYKEKLFSQLTPVEDSVQSDPGFDYDVDDRDKYVAYRRARTGYSSDGDRLERNPTLVLNANYVPISYMPLSLWNWQDSIRAVLSDKAVALHNYDIQIRSTSFSIAVPSVIVLRRYQKLAVKAPVLTRRNGTFFLRFKRL